MKTSETVSLNVPEEDDASLPRENVWESLTRSLPATAKNPPDLNSVLGAANADQFYANIEAQVLEEENKRRKEAKLLIAHKKSRLQLTCCCYSCCSCLGRANVPDEDDPTAEAYDEFNLILHTVGIEDLGVIDLIRGGRTMKHMPQLKSVPRKLSVASSDSDILPETSGNDLRDEENGRKSSRSSSRSSIDPAMGIATTELKRFLRLSAHAQAAYGHNFNSIKSFYQEIPTNPLQTTRAVILGKLDMKPENLRLLSPGKGPFSPLYYVAVDHRIRSIVLCIRGTSSMSDIMTDLAADSYTFLTLDPRTSDDTLIKGKTHAGIFLSARKIVQQARGILVDLVKELPDYPVTITGHSLGAGAAVLAAILLYNDLEFRHTEIQCVAFGCPPALSHDVAVAFEGMVVSIVNHNDIVPRLSVVALAKYFEVCKAVHALPWRKRFLIDLSLWRAAKVDEIEIPDLQYMEPDRLYLCGTVLHMRPNQDFTSLSKCCYQTRYFCCRCGGRPLDKTYCLVPCDRNHFWRVKMKPGTFIDHAPQLYTSVLKRIFLRREDHEERLSGRNSAF